MTFPRFAAVRPLFLRRLLVLLLLTLLGPGPAVTFAGTPRPEDSPVVQAARRALADAPDDRSRFLDLIHACWGLDTVEGRREADRIFRKALLKWPRDTELLLTFAELKEERRFYGQARRLFRRALKEEPGLVPARLGLARLSLHDYRRLLDVRELRRGAEELERVLELDPANIEALAQAAFAHWTLRDTLRADARAHALAEHHPDDPRGHFFLMTFASERGRWEEAGDHAARALGCLQTPGELEAFDTLERLDFRIEDRRHDVSTGHRIRIETEFWRRRDPTPATDLNERRLEHLRRVFMADQLYGMPESGLRGWETDAGEAVVRFGVPEKRWLGLGAQVLYMFQPNRLYQRHSIGDDDLTLYFDDPFLNGMWVEPYDWGSPSDMDQLAALIEATMDHPVGGPPIDIVLDAHRFRDPDGRTRLDVVVAVPNAPDSATTWSRPMAAYDASWTALDRVAGRLDGGARVDDRELPGERWLVDLVSFRIPPGIDTVQIGTQVEAGVGRGFGSRMDRFLIDPLPVESLALSDILLLDRIAFEAGDGDGAAAPASAPEVASAAANVGAPAAASEVAPAAANVGAPAAAPAAASHFARGGGVAVPHPTAIYETGENVPIYFEMYGLGLDAAGQTHFDITVEVLDLKRTSDWRERRGEALIDRRETPKSHARVTFEERGTTERAERLLEVSVGRLSRGDYALRVRVDDRIRGQHFETETAFRVVRPPKGSPGRAPAP